MQIITYQALLSKSENVARVEAARRQIERVGGRVTMTPAQRVGMVLVILELPEQYRPDAIFPDLPFYPIRGPSKRRARWSWHGDCPRTSGPA
ncbi:MAG: hypothetical protein ACM3N4_12955 [Nitrososphaerota archaeon]